MLGHRIHQHDRSVVDVYAAVEDAAVIHVRPLADLLGAQRPLVEIDGVGSAVEHQVWDYASLERRTRCSLPGPSGF